MTRSGHPETVEGVLSLDRVGLTFESSERTVRIPADEIREATRLRGSPVLRVDYEDAGEAAHAFFFFTEPPPLPAQPRPSPLSPRGLRRAGNILSLRAQNKQLKPELREWERAVRALRGG
jgi:hypothetical protein